MPIAAAAAAAPRLLVEVAEEGEAGDAEEGVEHVGDVARAVRDAAVVPVLALQDEGLGESSGELGKLVCTAGWRTGGVIELVKLVCILLGGRDGAGRTWSRAVSIQSRRPRMQRAERIHHE